MNTLLMSLVLASFTTFVSIYLLRPFAVSIDLLDRPNNRKAHKGAIPLIGGFAMYVAVVISILSSSYDLNQYNYYLLTSLFIVVLGVMDDYKNISVMLRLFFQILVAILIASAGSISIESLGNLFGADEIILSEWSYFVTVFAIIVGINAVNMSDGIHGLAGGNSLITFLAIAFLVIRHMFNTDSVFIEDIFIVLLFCSVLPVFLIHNLCLGMSERKRIFMGDAGSMLIGLTIAWTLIDQTQGEDRAFAPVTALWLFALPLFEMLTAILRRLTSGISPFKPDLYHIHHLLLRLGIGEKYTLILMLIFSLLTAVIGVLGELFNAYEWAMFVGFILVFVIYNITYRLALKSIQENSK